MNSTVDRFMKRKAQVGEPGGELDPEEKFRKFVGDALESLSDSIDYMEDATSATRDIDGITQEDMEGLHQEFTEATATLRRIFDSLVDYYR